MACPSLNTCRRIMRAKRLMGRSPIQPPRGAGRCATWQGKESSELVLIVGVPAFRKRIVKIISLLDLGVTKQCFDLFFGQRLDDVAQGFSLAECLSLCIFVR